MRSRLRRQYYCDFCRKSSGHAGHMRRHESACTGNPNRVCKMCVRLGVEQRPLADIVADVRAVKVPTTTSNYYERDARIVEALRKATSGCPACMLAVMRFDVSLSAEWNFQEEMSAAWDRIGMTELAEIGNRG